MKYIASAKQNQSNTISNMANIELYRIITTAREHGSKIQSLSDRRDYTNMEVEIEKLNNFLYKELIDNFTEDEAISLHNQIFGI